jgi:hypothetical protein
MKVKKRNDTISKCKKRIQDLLKRFVRARYGRCLAETYGECSGVLSADHIVGRTKSRTYWLPLNVVSLCMRHHLYWKPSHSGYWADEVQALIGKETWDHLHLLGRPTCDYPLWKWQINEQWLHDLVVENEHGVFLPLTDGSEVRYALD